MKLYFHMSNEQQEHANKSVLVFIFDILLRTWSFNINWFINIVLSFLLLNYTIINTIMSNKCIDSIILIDMIITEHWHWYFERIVCSLDCLIKEYIHLDDEKYDK